MIRLELLRNLAVQLAGGVVGTTTATGSTTTAVDTNLIAYPNDYFTNGWHCYFESGTLIGTTVAITDFVSSTGTLTFPTAAGSPGSGVRYILVKTGDIDRLQRTIHDAWAELAEYYPQPYLNEEITLSSSTFDYDVPYGHEADLTVDSGTTTTIVDAALTQANDYWLGAVVVITSGSSYGEVRTVTDFVASTDTLTVETPFSSAMTAGVTYTLYKARPLSIHDLSYLDDGGEYQEIVDECWELTRRGGVPQIHFYNYDSDLRWSARRWAIADGQVLRITGMRAPVELQSDGDPVEFPQNVMLAWCRYMWHANHAKQPALDAGLSIQQLQYAYAHAVELRDRSGGGQFPAGSRKV